MNKADYYAYAPDRFNASTVTNQLPNFRYSAPNAYRAAVRSHIH